MSLDIILGDGDKLVSDIYDPVGGWTGIAIRVSETTLKIGEELPQTHKPVKDIPPILTIKTTNKESLDVLINALERAKGKLHKIRDINLILVA